MPALPIPVQAAAELAAFHESLTARLAPADAVEEQWVGEIAVALWQQQKLQALAVLALAAAESGTDEPDVTARMRQLAERTMQHLCEDPPANRTNEPGPRAPNEPKPPAPNEPKPPLPNEPGRQALNEPGPTPRPPARSTATSAAGSRRCPGSQRRPTVPRRPPSGGDVRSRAPSPPPRPGRHRPGAAG